MQVIHSKLGWRINSNDRGAPVKIQFVLINLFQQEKYTN